MTKKMKKLTAAEKQWIAKLEAVLSECPSSRIHAFTFGDENITLYDKSLDGEIAELQGHKNYDFGPAAYKVGAILYVVDFPFPVHSTAG
ncbi:MAG: hypothetical protein ACRC16_20360 [Aeromonas salmonicida]